VSQADTDRADSRRCQATQTYPTDEEIAFLDDASCGNPLRRMFTDARVPWCPSCAWSLAQLDATAKAAAGEAPALDAERAAAGPAAAGCGAEQVTDVKDTLPSGTDLETTVSMCDDIDMATTTAGGRIWLHALEYRFTFNGHRYEFQTPLPDFVWGAAVPDWHGVCSKV
jgi:hypothetical protein